MKYWVKEFINQIKDNNEICANCDYKKNLHKNITSNDNCQIVNDERMPLLQEHTSNNKCIVIEIESNISAVNNIVEINLQGKQIEQKKQTTNKLPNYGSIC
ncbi:hypothetical protein [Spiroplasma endosymbiont of Monopis laevigella]|uniref:hypothetical protein n=1 Tax=Spiroplasma endosymbiont of Monopis laevigella TaxID=3066312 RepID=UPI0030D2CA7E